MYPPPLPLISDVLYGCSLGSAHLVGTMGQASTLGQYIATLGSGSALWVGTIKLGFNASREEKERESIFQDYAMCAWLNEKKKRVEIQGGTLISSLIDQQGLGTWWRNIVLQN